MSRPTDARIYAVYEQYERERAAKGRFDAQWAIRSAAEELDLTYAEVRDVVMARMLARTGG